jgi:hypothetical protein
MLMAAITTAFRAKATERGWRLSRAARTDDRPRRSASWAPRVMTSSVASQR